MYLNYYQSLTPEATPPALILSYLILSLPEATPPALILSYLILSYLYLRQLLQLLVGQQGHGAEVTLPHKLVSQQLFSRGALRRVLHQTGGHKAVEAR